MTREEAIRELKADYCGNRIICELYPDQCNREDCEIWLAIKALETQPDGDAVSRQDAIRIVDSIDTWQAGWRGDAIESLKALPSAQPEPIKITIDHAPTPDELERLKQAMRNTPVMLFPSTQPEITPDGTLTVSIDADIANVGRILLSQAGTQRGGLYYKDEQPEIIRCPDCYYSVREDNGKYWCNHPQNICVYVKPTDYCSKSERRADERQT